MTESNNISEIVNNPSIKRLIWYFTVAVFTLGCFLIFLSTIFVWHPLKIFLLLVGSYIAFVTLLRIIAQYSDIKVSKKSIQLAGSAMAFWVVIAIYFFPNLTFRWIITGGISLALLLLAFLSRFMLLFFESFIPRMYYKNFKLGESDYAGSSSGIAILEPGISTLYGKRILREFIFESMKAFRDTPFMFVNILSFQKRSPDFALQAVKNSSAMIVVIQAENKMGDDFRKMLEMYFKLSPGRIFVIQISRRSGLIPAIFKGRGIDTFEFVPSTRSLENDDTYVILSHMTNQITTNVIPLGESDDKLSSVVRSQTELLASWGLPPLADCYLRFRLSQSNVERFISLLDCIEVVIKISVMYLLINQWSKNIPGSSQYNFFTRSPLGHWIGYLRKLMDSKTDDEITQSIKQFWKKSPEKVSSDLIQDASVQGMRWDKAIPANYLSWLEWFVWLRNVSRGHGAVSEVQVTPLWHGLHETFLYMVMELKLLMIDCSVVKMKDNITSGKLRGWNRAPSQLEGEVKEETKTEMLFLVGDESLRKLVYPTFPFMIIKEGEVLFLNSINEKSIDYISFNSGRLTNINNEETNAYKLWKTQEVKQAE